MVDKKKFIEYSPERDRRSIVNVYRILADATTRANAYREKKLGMHKHFL